MLKFSLTILILSIVSQLCFAQNGEIIFNNLMVHTLEIVSNEPSGTLVNTLNQMRIADVESAVDITEVEWNYLMVGAFFDGEFIDSIGLRMKCGDVSCSVIKPSLKLDMNEFVSGKKYDGLKKINVDNCLHDPSLIREKIGYDLFGNIGESSRRTSFVNVVLDGEEYGTYVYIEQINKDYVKRCYGNKDGNLFKFNGRGMLKLVGNNEEEDYTHEVDLKTNETENDWSDLLLLIDKVNNTAENQFQDTISKYINVDAVLTYLAVANYMVYTDNLFSGGNNGYWYHNTETDKWEIIPHDLDLTFLADDNILGYNYSPENTQFINPINFNSKYPGVFTRILQVPEFENTYYEKCCQLSQQLGHRDSLKARVDFYKTILENAGLTPNPNMDYLSFAQPGNVYISDYTFYGIKDFAEVRHEKFLANFVEVEFECNEISGILNVQNPAALNIFPNPVSHSMNIEFNDNIQIEMIQIYNNNGKLVMQLSNSLSPIDISPLSNGIYFIVATTKRNNFSNKIIICK